MVLTATKTLILRNHSERRTGPLLFSHYDLMLDSPPTLYSSNLSTQYVHSVQDRFNIHITCKYMWIYGLWLSTTSHYYTCNLRGTGLESVTSQKVSVILQRVGISVAQTLDSSLVTLACGETVFHSMLHFRVHILKGSSAENRPTECYSTLQKSMPSWFWSHYLSYSRRGQSFDNK